MLTPPHFLAQIAQDMRYALRNFARSRSFSLIAICSLALGIGGTTAMYSVIYGVVLHPFIYKEADRLMSVQVIDGSGRSNYSYYPIDQFLDIADGNAAFSGVIASTWSDVTLTGTGEPQRLRGNHCTLNTFNVMGVRALLGRTTNDTDGRENAEPVAVLGYKFWQRQFGGDAAVIGTKLRLNNKVRTVIGVMPKRFMWRGADVYLPDVLRRGQTLEGESDVSLIGRLQPNITRAQAEANLEPIVREMQRRDPNGFPEKWRLRLRSFEETFPSSISEALWILFGAVGLLLLIACVNVSNLLLSHLAERRREIALRSALGASRARLLSQLLSEALVLALAGGLLGAVVAYAGLKGVLAMVPTNTIPDEAEVTLNGAVLFFTIIISLASALFIGVIPGLVFSGGAVAAALKEEGRSATASGRQRWLRGALVTVEVALSLMLLSAASLMMRTLLSMQSPDIGMQPNRILTMRIPLSAERYRSLQQRNAFLDDVAGRIAAVPGVAGVGLNSGLPPIGNFRLPVQLEGASRMDGRLVVLHQTNAGYARALGLTMLSGKFLSEVDVRGQLHYAVANQAFVRRYFGSADAAGKLVHLPQLRKAPANLKNDAFQIIGVTKDAVNDVSTQARDPELFIPFTVAPMADRVYVAGAVKPESLERSVKQQVYAADPSQPITDVHTLAAMLDEYVYAGPKFNLLLFAIFAGLGLVMALLGVYGVIANGVAQRRKEIGIRFALGARPAQVIGMVLADSAKLLALGTVLGILGSVTSSRLLSKMVYNVSSLDPLSLATVVLLLTATGLAASFWPARRAAQVDPLEALRQN